MRKLIFCVMMLLGASFVHGADDLKAIEEEFVSRLKRADSEAAWDWLEKLASKKDSSDPNRERNVIGLYGFMAFRRFRPDRARRALELCRKRGVEPGHYASRWLTTIRTFDEFEKFPRAEADIKFPEAPAWFGAAKGKTVRVKDLGFNPTDMTAAIQKAIDDPAVGTIVFDKTEAPWRVSSLKPRSNLTFVFEKGVRILADEDTQRRKTVKERRALPLFNLNNVSNVVFVGKGESPADVRIGQYETYEERKKFSPDYGGSGFLLENCENIVLYNLTVADTAMDGLCIGGLKFPTHGVYVRDVVFESNLRQACSLCNVDGIYFKNVAFNDTRGRSPMCGIDVEPSIQEVQAVCEIYLFDCSFKGNAGSHLNFSCSSAYPVTLYAKRCDFAPNASGNVEIFALPGVYFKANVAAPSKIIFDECNFRQFADKKAIRFRQSSFFNVAFRNSTIEEVAPQRAGRERFGAPVSFELERTYAKPMACDKPGKVVFGNLHVKGWKDSPTIAFRDTAGTYSVTNLHGVILHNGKKVKASEFRHLSPETALNFIDGFDPNAYAPPKKNRKPAKSVAPRRMSLGWGGPWFEPKPTYEAIWWDGTTWATRVVEEGMKNLGDLDGKVLAYVGKPVSIWGLPPSAYSPAYQITAGKDFGGDTFYFEVPALAGECVIRLTGDAEVRDASGRVVGAYVTAEDGEKGAKYVRFTAKSKKPEIFSVRIRKSASVKFFKPLTGVIAETPEGLPRLKDARTRPR